MSSSPKPVVLCILDGWGLREDSAGNAPALARTPHFDRLMAECPHATLITHGPDAGLPRGQMGNSEVGHTNIGAGRVVAMDLGQIDLAIEDGSFFENPALRDFIARLKESGGRAHLMGMISDGGVHGHIDHIKAAIRAIGGAGIEVLLHAITDGRDVAPRSALGFLDGIAPVLAEFGGRIATLGGRYYAMDRDRRWERVKRAHDAIVHAEGPRFETARQVVEAAYAEDVSDEFILPAVVGDHAGMGDGDALFCLNFRADRVREILAAIGDPQFDAFDTGRRPKLAALLGMADYSERHNTYMSTCFPKQEIVNTLGSWVAQHGLRQFRLAETEKYPHVTFFLNGGREEPEQGEERYMAPSPKVPTYDQKPEMSAVEVTDHLVTAIRAGYDLIVVNYANPDMVGHTGDLKAAIAACEAVDRGLGQMLDALAQAGGAAIVTADHGNCETMIDPQTGGPHTAHTMNPVPVIAFGLAGAARMRSGRLADLAPTVLGLMGLPVPPEMTGRNLLVR